MTSPLQKFVICFAICGTVGLIIVMEETRLFALKIRSRFLPTMTDETDVWEVQKPIPVLKSDKSEFIEQIPKPRPDIKFNTNEIMKQRVQHLTDNCKSPIVKEYKFNFSQNNERFYMNKDANLSYCKVPKAGSSFLTEVFLTLAIDSKKKNSKKKRTMDKLFEKSRDILHNIGNRMVTKQPLTSKNLKTLNVLVSRDPYSRLFSAFVDKYFLFGHVATTKEIANYLGRNLSQCGYDLTFQEFLDHVIEGALKGGSINRHWSPVYLLCHACDIKYHVVGKLESLTHDVEFMLNHSNVKSSRRTQLFELFHTTKENKTILGLLQTYLKQWEKNKKICPDLVDYLQRVWISLQIQGKIKSILQFPKAEFVGLSYKNETHKSQMSTIVLNYMTSYSMTSQERQAQRRKALVDAYNKVSRQTIIHIQQLYALDFLLFNYDKSPPT